MILHSKCESAQYAELACHVAAWQRRHLANDNKMSDRADDPVVQRVCHGSSKIGKRKQLRILHQNVARLSLFWNNNFPYFTCCDVRYDKSANKDTVKFLAKFGAISPSTRKSGTKQWIQSRDVKITPYSQLLIKYSSDLRANKEKK